MANQSYALWAIWIELPLLHKLFFLILTGVGVYSFFSAATILARLRSIMKRCESEDIPHLQLSVASLNARAGNVRQLIGVMFCLFGLVFLLGLRFAFWTPDSKTPVDILIIENFYLYFAFAANTSFVFLLLVSVQWYIFSRLQACALHLDRQALR
jgi:hypothetical protein